MPFRVGALAYPVALILLTRQMPSAASAFRKAGALSPKTARKPTSVGLSGVWLFEGAVRKGLIVPTGDGRYYLDAAKDRARQRRLWAIVVGVLVVTTPLLFWALS
ncbi:MAG: hypothetical protein R3B68_06515 [Phycisphaerales bacterium]